jgi:predicted DNA-binding transcriptional regulator AlpA
LAFWYCQYANVTLGGAALHSGDIETRRRRPMSLLDGFLTADQVSADTGKSTRTLRDWRNQRTGPPWAQMGNTVIYPEAEFKAWLRDQIVRPVRSNRNGRGD